MHTLWVRTYRGWSQYPKPILEDDILKTNGGRVLLVTGEGMTLKEAQERAYNNILKIKCENLIYRKDIGNKSLRGRKDG